MVWRSQSGSCAQQTARISSKLSSGTALLTAGRPGCWPTHRLAVLGNRVHGEGGGAVLVGRRPQGHLMMGPRWGCKGRSVQQHHANNSGAHGTGNSSQMQLHTTAAAGPLARLVLHVSRAPPSPALPTSHRPACFSVSVHWDSGSLDQAQFCRPAGREGQGGQPIAYVVEQRNQLLRLLEPSKPALGTRHHCS